MTKPFYLAESETTQETWQRVMGDNPSQAQGKNRPVVSVSWEMVQKFVAKLNGGGTGLFRLPTEAEWEYACRAGTKTRFGSGETLTHANFDADGSRVKSQPVLLDVRSLEANEWGLFDLHGNAAEWCSDRYSENYYQRCFPEVSDPQGPDEATNNRRVVRGGSWFHSRVACRSADRLFEKADRAEPYIGFRVARSL
jgi:formylglycine-generating enzyme required for sulfatase activity